ncbi:MAG: 16S rRNA processing protein RimM [Clostridia bacterium]|nr:16S rRNA processing protein RimM [Clostridia bacterium]
MSKVEVGKIVNTRGLRGEVKIYPYLDEIEVFNEFEYLLVDNKEYKIKGIKFFKNMVFVTFFGVDSVEAAESLKNQLAEVYVKDLPELSDGEFYIKDILGMEVVKDDGEKLGIIKNVLRTGSNDVYEVERDGKKPMYLPAIKDVIINTDLDSNRMTVHIIPGLDEI